MKESFEQPQIVPEKNLETMYLEQGVEVQEALNAALLKARKRKIMLEMKDPEKEPFFITKEEVQILKDKYDEEFKKLQELGKDLPEDTLMQFSELDTLEEWEDRLEMWQRASTEQTQKFVRKPTEEELRVIPEKIEEMRLEKPLVEEEAPEEWKPTGESKVYEKTETPVVPVDPQTEPGWNKLHPDEQQKKVLEYLAKKKESEEWKKAA